MLICLPPLGEGGAEAPDEGHGVVRSARALSVSLRLTAPPEGEPRTGVRLDYEYGSWIGFFLASPSGRGGPKGRRGLAAVSALRGCEPFVDVGVGIVEIVLFTVLGSVTVTRNGDGKVITPLEGYFTNICYPIRQCDTGQPAT